MHSGLRPSSSVDRACGKYALDIASPVLTRAQVADLGLLPRRGLDHGMSVGIDGLLLAQPGTKRRMFE